jgi:hypothetical protein
MFVCVSVREKDGSPEEYLLAPICTFKSPANDTTCSLGPGDYNALVSPSYIAYHLMKTMTRNELEKANNDGDVKRERQMPSGTLQRVRIGVTVSLESKPKHQAFYEAHK